MLILELCAITLVILVAIVLVRLRKILDGLEQVNNERQKQTYQLQKIAHAETAEPLGRSPT